MLLCCILSKHGVFSLVIVRRSTMALEIGGVSALLCLLLYVNIVHWSLAVTEMVNYYYCIDHIWKSRH